MKCRIMLHFIWPKYPLGVSSIQRVNIIVIGVTKREKNAKKTFSPYLLTLKQNMIKCLFFDNNQVCIKI